MGGSFGFEREAMMGKKWMFGRFAVVVSCNQQSPSSSAFVIETKETPEKIERDPYTLEPAAEEHNQMECSSDYLCSPSLGVVTEICLHEFWSL